MIYSAWKVRSSVSLSDDWLVPLKLIQPPPVDRVLPDLLDCHTSKKLLHSTRLPRPNLWNTMNLEFEWSAGWVQASGTWGESWFFISKLAIQHLPSQIICMERMISCDIPANLSVWLSKGELCFPPRNEHILRVLGISSHCIYDYLWMYQCILMYINVY